MSALATLGAAFLGMLAAVGRIAIFAAETLSHLLRPPFYPREFGAALINIGYFSLPVVGLTTIFTGGALALQIFAGGARFSAEAVVPQIVAIGMVRELGPVLVGLMIAARVTASIAAEIATMKVTQQIDALKMLRTDPIDYLVMPRVLSCAIMLPVLTILALFCGGVSGGLITTQTYELSMTTFLDGVRGYLSVSDVLLVLLKAALFGFVIAVASCSRGLTAAPHGKGVGQAATSAGVTAWISLFLIDLVISCLSLISLLH